ncbi:hypothetical protein PISMIDRAFT_671698 [Pisolithus microcarpus 441]|uniref:Unplaced genomic scaffold scaffold_4, whole genome shotgun sequence n=1 Tax=Pisolithus microcarpus 441 TaxID=765257 RepID=A0A0D0ACE3_9AGAM|nr:hypothetical protein PISMIDRAFT_671698 [Pisolithus microcarpus 441]
MLGSVVMQRFLIDPLTRSPSGSRWPVHAKAWSELAGSLFVTLYKNQCYLQCDIGCNFCTGYPIDLWTLMNAILGC